MAVFQMNHKPSVTIHGLFGYLWFSVELLIGTARVTGGKIAGR